jgi:hypothetical protein
LDKKRAKNGAGGGEKVNRPLARINTNVSNERSVERLIYLVAVFHGRMSHVTRYRSKINKKGVVTTKKYKTLGEIRLYQEVRVKDISHKGR